MVDDVRERDDAGDPLGEVGPVAGPRIDVDAGAATEGDEDAVEGVEGEGQENQGPFQDAHERERVAEFDLLGVGEGAVPGFEVGNDVLEEEGADGDDAGKGVELVPEEGVALACAEGLDASAGWLARCRSVAGRCHGSCCGHREGSFGESTQS